MPSKLFNKGLVIGIIVLFIGVSVLSSVSSKDISVSNDKVVDDNEGGYWKTNYYCRINVYGDDCSFCEPELGLFFLRNARIYGNIDRCTISGKNGADVYNNGYLDLYVQYLFGYCRFFWDSWSSWAVLRGFAIKCWYKVV